MKAPLEKDTRALEFCVEPGCTARVPAPRCSKHSRSKRKRPVALNRALSHKQKLTGSKALPGT